MHPDENQPNQQPPTYPQPAWGTAPIPPTPPKKNNNPVIITAIIVVLLLCLGCFGFGLVGSAVDDHDAAVDAPASSAGISPEPSTESKPAAEWETVLELKGTGYKQSKPFHLTGGDVRVAYSVADTSGQDMSLVGIYVLDKGHDFERDGGIPEVTTEVGWSGDDDTAVTREAGDYFVKVIAANARWSVTVQELR